MGRFHLLLHTHLASAWLLCQGKEMSCLSSYLSRMLRWPEGQDNRSWAFVGEGNPQTGKSTPGSFGEKQRAAGLRESPAGFSSDTESSEALKAKPRAGSMGFAICLGHLWSLLMPRDWLWSRSRENESGCAEKAGGLEESPFCLCELDQSWRISAGATVLRPERQPFQATPGFPDSVSSPLFSLEMLCLVGSHFTFPS